MDVHTRSQSIKNFMQKIPQNSLILIQHLTSFILFTFQFERALVLFHRGLRLRVPLYGDSFMKGIDKTTTAIITGLQALSEKMATYNHQFKGERNLEKKEYCEVHEPRKSLWPSFIYTLWCLIFSIRTFLSSG